MACCDQPRFQVGSHARFPAERKRGSNLHSRRALVQRLAQLGRAAIPASQPEGNAQRAQLRDVHPVALAVDRLPGGVELQLAARRRIVPARRWAFDHKPIDAPVGPPQHGRGQRIRGNDGQKPGPVEHRQRTLGIFGRIEPHQRVHIRKLRLRRAGHGQAVLSLLVRRKGVQARRECAAVSPRPSARSPRRPAWLRKSKPGAASAPFQDS